MAVYICKQILKNSSAQPNYKISFFVISNQDVDFNLAHESSLGQITCWIVYSYCRSLIDIYDASESTNLPHQERCYVLSAVEITLKSSYRIRVSTQWAPKPQILCGASRCMRSRRAGCTCISLLMGFMEG